MPKRIQRKRTKGFDLQAASSNPNGVVYVGRPSQFGNPFKIGHRYQEGDSFLKHYGQYLDDGLVTADNCLRAFRAYCDVLLKYNGDYFEPLRSKDLACWCREDQPCHADILLELANKEAK